MSSPISTAHVRNWLEQFLISKRSAGLAPKTIHWYRERLGLYLAWVDSHNGLGPLDATALEYFLASRRQTNAPSTVQSTYRCLSTFCAWLVKRRHITPNESPILLVDKPKLPVKRMDYVTKAQFDTLYAGIRGISWTAHRDRLLFTILFYSGLRAGEVMRLRVEDFESGVIMVHAGKGAKDRVVPYAPDVPALLDAYLQARPPGAEVGALFVSNNGMGGIRGAMEYDGFKEMMRRRCRKAGLPRLKLHAFRHGFAMWALNAGVPLSALSAMMGHSSTVVTESIYARWVTSALTEQYGRAFAHHSAGPSA